MGALCVSAATAFAKIGETRPQIEARMGAATTLNGQEATFVKGGFQVVATFFAGTSVVEVVSKVSDDPVHPATFSDNEVTSLLAAYANGLPWTKQGFEQRWKRSDNKVLAEADDTVSSIRFSDNSYLLTQAKAKEDARQARELQRNAVETHRVADVFGPIISPSPTATEWKTPSPNYPAQARMSRVQGTTKVRVSTDATGNISSVVIVKSVGSAILDANTQGWAKMNWHGPANATRDVEFAYRLQ